MSTRATYGFEDRHGNTIVTYYIHHDGYPQGAAMYFWNMCNVLLKGTSANLATVFCNANERAEVTTSHEAHPDTEFRYQVDYYGKVTATSIQWFDVNPYVSFSEPKFIDTIYRNYIKFISANDDMLKGEVDCRLINATLGKLHNSQRVLN